MPRKPRPNAALVALDAEIVNAEAKVLQCDQTAMEARAVLHALMGARGRVEHETSRRERGDKPARVHRKKAEPQLVLSEKAAAE